MSRELLMGFQFPDGHAEERVVPQPQGQSLITNMWKDYHAVLKYSTFADTSHYAQRVEEKREELGIAPQDTLIESFPEQTNADILRQKQIEQGIITPALTLIPTLDVNPLITEELGRKMLNQGFSEDVVKPLMDVTTAQNKISEVNDFMNEAEVRGITPPRDIIPSSLIVTPTTPSIAPSIDGGGLLLVLLLALIMVVK